MESLKSIEETAEVLGLSAWTVRRYCQLGKITPIRIGRRVLIEPSEIERVIEAGRTVQTSRQSFVEGTAIPSCKQGSNI